MTPPDAVPLESLSDIPLNVILKLHAAWVRTAEQLVATTSAGGGAANMAEHLGVSPAEFEKALAAAESAIPSSVLRRLKTPADIHGRGLGANPPNAE